MTSTTQKPRILILCDHYLPGYKSGGGMRTIVNMVDRLSDRFDFHIVTRDHDGNLDTDAYTTVAINDWNLVGKVQVYYLSRDNIRIKVLRKLILSARPDAIYTNSFFSSLTIFALQLRKLRLIPKLRIIIAPCGELSDGSLRVNPRKKGLFVSFSRVVNLYKNVVWKASTELEKADIQKLRPKGGKIIVAPDLPARHLFKDYDQKAKPAKQTGEARMVFLARFVRTKNFKWLLERLGDSIVGRLVIHIYGPLEDARYWRECKQLIDKLPDNIEIEAFGPVPHKNVVEKLFHYHFFLLPTLGENFGHVFIESLAAGCPLVISDRTPWLDLQQKGIGWDISLETQEKWVETINKCIEMDAENYSQMSAAARSFAENWLDDPAIEQMTVAVLQESLKAL